MIGNLVRSWSNAIQFEEPIDHNYLNSHPSSVDYPSSSYNYNNMSYDKSHSGDKDHDGRTNDTNDNPEEHVRKAKDHDEGNTSNETVQQCETTRDEWGHFADFQDELADESSFIPSCRVTLTPDGRRSSITTTTLQTLSEVVEHDCDDDDVEEEEWSF